MNIVIDKLSPWSALAKLLKYSVAKVSIVCASLCVLGLFSHTALANRFDPPSLKLPLESFDSRIESNIFNVDFLVSHVVNNSRKIVRETEEIGDTAINTVNSIQNTSIIRNNSNSDSVSAGSVLIPVGTRANTIIIINQNEGDSIAIQR